MKIIRYTIFNSLIDGNGANKRTAQITEILENSGIESLFVKKDETINVTLFDVFLHAIPALRIITKALSLSYFKNIKSILKAIRNYLRTERNLLQALKSDSNLILWECTRSDNFFVPLLAKQYGKHVISLLHNIESLVPNQSSSVSLKQSPQWFDEEISYLSKCDISFCVSKEETLLLKLFGIPAFYFPFYPTIESEQFFLQIRDKRLAKIPNNKHTKKLLMLGSANNQPTNIGMVDRINFFTKNKPENISVYIAGFFTETLSEYASIPENINILGTLSNNDLEELLINVDAILIHQPATTGALNRIPEMLIAGVPIILNFESARNYYGTDGLYIYENDEQFMNLLLAESYIMPELPINPVDQGNRFINYIKQLS
jgi:hypothetical protein